ncbi:MAG: VWA domain-containing protein [Candidatus Zixiibacteriota bacterium]
MTDHLERVEFPEEGENWEPRCPVVLLLDNSGSMTGDPIQELNEGLKTFDREVKADKLASLRVDLSIVTFGGHPLVVDPRGGYLEAGSQDVVKAFATADLFVPPVLTTGGLTPLGAAARLALQLIRDRKEMYKKIGLDHFRPWVFLISDGAPTDNGWEQAAAEARAEEDRDGVIVFPVGIRRANLAALGQFSSKNKPLRLHGLAFNELFVWLSKSLSAVSRSLPGSQSAAGTQVALPPVGWSVVDTSTK